MANRKWDKLQTIGHDRKIVEGSFAPAGAGAPTNLDGSGVKTVVRDLIGHYTVTCDRYSDLESAVASGQSLGTLVNVHIAAVAPGSFQVRTVDAAGAAIDLAADPNNRINFRLVYRNSTRR